MIGEIKMQKIKHREKFIYIDKNGKEIVSLIINRKINRHKLWHLYYKHTEIPDDE